MTFFSPDFSSQRRNRLSQYQTLLQQLTGRRQAANNQYASSAAQIDMEKPTVFRNILNSAASRGMARSSGYGQEVAQTNADFSNQFAGLATNRDAELSAADLDQNAGYNDYQYDLSDLDNQQAYYDAQNNQNLVATLAQQKQQQADLGLTHAKTAQAIAQAKAAKKKPLARMPLRKRI